MLQISNRRIVILDFVSFVDAISDLYNIGFFAAAKQRVCHDLLINSYNMHEAYSNLEDELVFARGSMIGDLYRGLSGVVLTETTHMHHDRLEILNRVVVSLLNCCQLEEVILKVNTIEEYGQVIVILEDQCWSGISSWSGRRHWEEGFERN
jgi:hypothetical protein